MAIRNKDEILSAIKEFIGENTDDSTLAMLEDIDDTFNDFTNRLDGTEDYKTQYDELKTKFDTLDSDWRKKYQERFFNPTKEDEQNHDDHNKNENEKKSYEDLFKTGE